jgi:hypothetical protein
MLANIEGGCVQTEDFNLADEVAQCAIGDHCGIIGAQTLFHHPQIGEQIVASEICAVRRRI